MQEEYESVKTHYLHILEAAVPGTAIEIPLECGLVMTLRVIWSPDGKMLNISFGLKAQGADSFCAQCKVTAQLQLEEPFRRWLATTMMAEHEANLQLPKTRQAKTQSVAASLVKCEFKEHGYCNLHNKVRCTEDIIEQPLRLANLSPDKVWRALVEQHIREWCGIKFFRLFGERDIKAGNMEWSNLQWPEVRKIIHSFDLTLLLSVPEFAGQREPGPLRDGEALPARILQLERLWQLWVLAILALDREPGENGHAPSSVVRVFVLAVIQLFMEVYGAAPTAVSC